MSYPIHEANATRVHLSSVKMQYDRSDSGPTRLAIAVSINDGLYQSIFTDDDVFVGDETHTISLSTFRSVNSTTFRLFAFNAPSTTGTLDIERFTTDPNPSRGIVVRGDITAVPEPGSFIMVAALMVLGLVASLRKRDALAFLRFHACC